MKIVNNHNAPASFIAFCSDDEYSRGNADYSATQLIDEVRVVHFNERHPDLIIDDPYENPWKFVSTIFHSLMEKNSPEGEIAEERLFAEIDGVTISGAMDVQVVSGDRVTIGDYKMTTVFAIKDTTKFEQQLNIYAWLIETCTDKKVDGLQIYAFLRDWKISMSEKMPNYPPTPGITIELPLWPYAEREQFIRDRIEALEESKELADDDLPACSQAGRWPGGTVWFVCDMNSDKRKHFPTKAKAKAYFEKLSPEDQLWSVIDKSFDVYRRCKSYCQFNNICNIHKGFLDDRKNRRS
jgi:hypothetical protein